MNISTISKTNNISTSIGKDKIAAISSILLGGVFIFIVGFANINAVHNAAHDTRHSAAFPCH
jgi:cobalt transporter subunit CbtB